MLFLGDFVYPFRNKIDFSGLGEEFIQQSKIVNLESPILEDIHAVRRMTQGIALHSSSSVFNVLKQLNTVSVGLANNHITDYDVDIDLMKEKFKAYGISSCGAGDTLSSSLEPAIVTDNSSTYAILSFGWQAIDCQYAGRLQKGIAPLEEELITHSIKQAKVHYPNAKVVLFLHWNYEFEYYPQPADRSLAFSAIDAGADAVFGHHTHIVGVYERYKNRPIFYSLGNFYIPEYSFAGVNLSYGDEANTGLGVSFDGNNSDIRLYWFRNENNCLQLTDMEALEDSSKIEDISDCCPDDMSSYKIWFKEKRRKKILLPVFMRHRSGLGSSLLLKSLNLRNTLVHLLKSLGGSFHG
jgi:hypothetical protein